MSKDKKVFVLTSKETIPLKKQKGKKQLIMREETPMMVLEAKTHGEVLVKLDGYFFADYRRGLHFDCMVLLLSEVEKSKKWERDSEKESLYRKGCRVFRLKGCNDKNAHVVFPPSGLTWGGVPLYGEPFVLLMCHRVPLVSN